MACPRCKIGKLKKGRWLKKDVYFCTNCHYLMDAKSVEQLRDEVKEELMGD